MDKRAFTLVEVLFTFGILAFCICGILLTYIQMFVLVDLSRDTTLATNAAQARMEELKRASFTSLSGFNGQTYDVSGFASGNAKCRVEVSDVTIRNPYTETLKRARVVVCFKSRGRVIGEDSNLNGNLDSGEDRQHSGEDGFGRLDSPVELVTLIAK
jgi:type II secretory pathway pseudopilin PulG